MTKSPRRPALGNFAEHLVAPRVVKKKVARFEGILIPTKKLQKIKKNFFKNEEQNYQGLTLAEDLGSGSGAVLEDVRGDHGVLRHVGGEVQDWHGESPGRPKDRSGGERSRKLFIKVDERRTVKLIGDP